ncbi:substrate-binding domain-containing protein, partial [Paracoccus sp. (in: a-proteobacteria)]|uniref:substrate-binding domain-containing protein n=1 Tax=Paracoccus sp. TaxID=267 RepID=UPI0028B1AA89
GLAPFGDLAGRPDLPPVISACEWIEAADLPRVMLDNREGGRLAVAHLRSLGHDHIGLIGGPPGNVLHKARQQGAHDAAGAVRITHFAGDFTMQSGQQAAQVWQDLAPAERPTGVFAFSDEMACAFMSGLQRAGHVVPRDVSIIGFDDIELVSHLTPALTTIRQPKREIGRKA